MKAPQDIIDYVCGIKLPKGDRNFNPASFSKKGDCNVIILNGKEKQRVNLPRKVLRTSLLGAIGVALITTGCAHQTTAEQALATAQAAAQTANQANATAQAAASTAQQAQQAANAANAAAQSAAQSAGQSAVQSEALTRSAGL